MARPATPRDPYDVLGVPRSADDTQIKKAFRALARELHPDVNTEDPRRRGEVQGGRRGLRDPLGPGAARDLRPLRPRGAALRRLPAELRPVRLAVRLFEAFFGGGGGASSAAAAQAARGGRRRRRRPRPRAAQAATGGTFAVAYETVDRCEHCNGNGAEPGTPIETCERCGGAGQLQAVTRTPFGQMMRTVVCDTCGGDGRVAVNPCGECRGRGRVMKTGRVTVEVPAGIADGQRVRITGRGPRRRARRPGGRSLRARCACARTSVSCARATTWSPVLDVPAPLAALGASFEVQTLDGHTSVEVAAGTQPGEVLTLRGQGMPRLRGHGNGDLRIVVNVQIPRRLTEEQRAMLEEFSATITPENLRSDESLFSRLRRALHGPIVIRLAVRVARADAPLALAELLAFSPAGVEEVDDDPDTVEYVLYGAPASCRPCPRCARASATRSSTSRRARSPTTGPHAGATSTSRSRSPGRSASAPPGTIQPPEPA